MKAKLTTTIAVLALLMASIAAYAVDSNKPPSHDLSWLHRHGPASKVNIEECIQCHTDRISCTQCHQEIQPRNHTPSWTKTGHGLEARWDRSRCMVCHKEDSCVECHQRTLPSSHRPGWGGGSGVSQNRHCTTCHYPVKDTTCFVCHNTAHAHNTYK
jgi:hypothetical protein